MLLAFHSSQVDLKTNVEAICHLADALLKESFNHWSVDVMWHFRQDNPDTDSFIEELTEDFMHEHYLLQIEPLGMYLYDSNK